MFVYQVEKQHKKAKGRYTLFLLDSRKYKWTVINTKGITSR